MRDSINIDLKVGSSHTIELPGLGTSGYTWVHDLEKENVVRISHQYVVPENPKPGQRGIEKFTFHGVGHGTCVVQFKQIQTWDKDQAPLDTRTVQIKVD